MSDSRPVSQLSRDELLVVAAEQQARIAQLMTELAAAEERYVGMRDENDALEVAAAAADRQASLAVQRVREMEALAEAEQEDKPRDHDAPGRAIGFSLGFVFGVVVVMCLI